MEETKHNALTQMVSGANGHISSMRVVTLFITATVLVTWVVFCFIEGRFIPLSWEDVTLIAGAQGAKALQGRFEWGPGGIREDR